MSWPSAHLDTIGRLRALAVALPGTALRERVFPAPFDEVWQRVTDFERAVPDFDPLVAQTEVVGERPGGLVIRSRPPLLPVWMRFEVDLEPGWCLMRSPLFLVGMAAVPDDDGRTRFAHLEGSPWRARLAAAMRPVVSWTTGMDLAGMERLFGEREEG